MSSFQGDKGSNKRGRRGNFGGTGGSRRKWSHGEEELLVNALKSIVSSNWKCENEFRHDYLQQLEAYMFKAFPNTNLKAEPYMNSKIHVWKKYYASLVGMMGISGFGWDDNKAMVTIDEIKIVSGMNMLRKNFGKDHATGECAEDIHAATNAEEVEEALQNPDCYLPTAKWNPDFAFLVRSKIECTTPISEDAQSMNYFVGTLDMEHFVTFWYMV
ncbi:UNVERIFIED_CONTAM: hypothetical protein Sangu_1978300 [Sesamum angustifolium]|uniref:Myb/SANT-like domain-containing protein n=1 Tax=Sesamum angustifolium TaxID=2727405 RepID=A0AAW2LYJ4_9LAMI